MAKQKQRESKSDSFWLLEEEQLMPKSRRRPGSKKRHGNRLFDPRTEIAKWFQEIGVNPERDLRYKVLYHYTSTAGALGILESQKFWATAHDCTNDKGELVSANATILDSVQKLRAKASGLPARVLSLFLQNYEKEMIARIRTAYLCCFSIPRDDPSQWQRYGGDGKGVCLGLRIINEPGPESDQTFSRLFEVTYSEEALRQWFSGTLEKTCSALSRYPITPQNLRAALASVSGIAAFASITTKTPEWSSEQEVRHVTMDKSERGVMPPVRTGADGKEIRYLPVSLRADGKLIALDEIIIGAMQDFDALRAQFESLLKAKGYTEGSIEYPRIRVSGHVGTPH
jgi:hypothetical protein